MQMVFQDPYSSLDPHVPVGESVAEPLIVHFKMDRKERVRKVNELLERVGMSGDVMERYPASSRAASSSGSRSRGRSRSNPTSSWPTNRWPRSTCRCARRC